MSTSSQSLPLIPDTVQEEQQLAMPELATPALARRLLAEFLGTALLLAIVAGSGIMAEQLAGIAGGANAAGTAAGQSALALLANSLATGAGLFVLIMIFGPVSGAHFNPVVSLVAWLQRQLPGRDCLTYLLAQCCGAITGVLATHAMFNLALWQHSAKVRNGGNLWWAEFIATFGLILTIQALSSRKTELPAIAASIGLYIVAAYWFTASTSFANPAVTLARSFTDTFTGIRMQDIAGFMVAQAAGAMGAMACAKALFTQPASA